MWGAYTGRGAGEGASRTIKTTAVLGRTAVLTLTATLARTANLGSEAARVVVGGGEVAAAAVEAGLIPLRG